MFNVMQKYVVVFLTVCSLLFLAGQQSAWAQGAGTGFSRPVDLTIRDDGSLFVVDENLDALLRVDVPSGFRRLVSGRDQGRGVPLGRPVGVAQRNQGNILIADRDLDVIVSVVPRSGNRTILSGCPQVPDPCPVSLVGGGLGFTDPVDVEVLDDDNWVVVDLRDGEGALFLVDSNTGDRELVSAAGVGRGPDLGRPVAVTVNDAGDVYVIDQTLDAVLRVNLVTGARTVISGCPEADDPCPRPLVGRGSELLRPMGIVSEGLRRLYVTDGHLGAVVRVDINTGNRTIISDARRGSGPILFDPTGIALESNDSLLVTDASRKSVLRVNIRSGDREVLSKRIDLILSPGSGTYGTGQNFDLAIFIDGQGDTLDLSVNINGRDFSEEVESCIREQRLDNGGTVLVCRDVVGALELDPGRYDVAVRASIGDRDTESVTLARTVMWNVLRTR